MSGPGQQDDDAKYAAMIKAAEKSSAAAESRAGDRELSPLAGKAVALLGISFSLFQIYTAGFGAFPNLIQRAIHLGFALVLSLALYSATKAQRGRLPVLDLIGMVAAVLSMGYIVVNYDAIVVDPTQSTIVARVLGTAAVLLVLETGRRVIGWSFPVLSAIALLYTYFGNFIPGVWGHRGFGFRFIIEQLYQTGLGIFGTTVAIVANDIAIFIILGTVVSMTGGGEAFRLFSTWLIGRSTGGPAKVATIASSLFGTVSGSSVANVAVTGSFTIPMMKRMGYPAHFAAGTEATASTGGQIMPPIMGAGAFVMAEFLHISYGTIAASAAIPAILYYLGVFMSIHLMARRSGLKGLPASEIPPAREVFTVYNAGTILLPFGAITYLIAKGFTVSNAGYWATVLALVLFVIKDFKPGEMWRRVRHIPGILAASGYSLVMVASIAACAQIVISMIGVTGAGVTLATMIISLSGGILLLALILAMVVALILGMGMPTTAAYVLAASVLAPALLEMGVQGLPAHMFLFYFAAISSITPPVCAAVFVAAGMAKCSWMAAAKVAMHLGVAAFIVPYMFIYANELLLQGSVTDILWRFGITALGVVAISAAISGFMIRANRWYETALLGLASVLLIFPSLIFDVVGLGLIGVPILLQVLRKEAPAAMPAAAQASE